MQTLFTTSTIQAVQSPLEILWWTGWPFDGTGGADSLSTGITQLVQCQNWNRTGSPTLQAAITALQSSQLASANYTYSADPADQQSFGQGTGDTSVAQTGTRIMPSRVQGVYTLTSQINNQTGSANTTYQLNFQTAVQRLTAMDKLFYQQLGRQGNGAYVLTNQETQALQNLNMMNAAGQLTQAGQDRLNMLIREGYLPLSPDKLIQNLLSLSRSRPTS